MGVVELDVSFNDIGLPESKEMASLIERNKKMEGVVVTVSCSLEDRTVSNHQAANVQPGRQVQVHGSTLGGEDVVIYMSSDDTILRMRHYLARELNVTLEQIKLVRTDGTLFDAYTTHVCQLLPQDACL